ncbi:DUF6702 family protein [Sphingomonas sp. Leaf25]|uniref:DUF6702 family protein n=1 Tax=Sphingomonas sp. Leaf25 TaxID=1735692 RepID=UPI0006FD8768|nr:DUF6702 family protein [Sphingomonas sp. Leaf25]KQN00502.1 hypothetical protein ASE78_05265 [Sphingomonas sp. Leaf25]
MRRWAALALGLAIVAPAQAHRGHDSLAVVTLADGSVTVSHRFEAHDIEPALAKIAPTAQTSLDDPVALAALEAYVLRRFTLTIDGKPVALTHVKTDLSHAEVRIEYRGRVPKRAKVVAVRSSVLSDVYRAQVNQVNVRRGTVVKSLTLRGGAAGSVTLG